MKEFCIEYRVTNHGRLIDESCYFVVANDADAAENAAYDYLDKEYCEIGRVKVMGITELGVSK